MIYGLLSLGALRLLESLPTIPMTIKSVRLIQQYVVVGFSFHYSFISASAIPILYMPTQRLTGLIQHLLTCALK